MIFTYFENCSRIQNVVSSNNEVALCNCQYRNYTNTNRDILYLKKKSDFVIDIIILFLQRLTPVALIRVETEVLAQQWSMSLNVSVQWDTRGTDVKVIRNNR